MEIIKPIEEEQAKRPTPEQLGELVSNLEELLKTEPVIHYAEPVPLDTIAEAFRVPPSRLNRKNLGKSSPYPISKPGRIPPELLGETLAEIEFYKYDESEFEGEIQVFESTMLIDPDGMTFVWDNECHGEECHQANAKARGLLLEAGFREVSTDDYGEKPKSVEIKLEPTGTTVEAPDGEDKGQDPTAIE